MRRVSILLAVTMLFVPSYASAYTPEEQAVVDALTERAEYAESQRDEYAASVRRLIAENRGLVRTNTRLRSALRKSAAAQARVMPNDDLFSLIARIYAYMDTGCDSWGIYRYDASEYSSGSYESYTFSQSMC